MASMASSVDNWSDSEIRTKLAELGAPVGPVTETTRKILVKKLKRLLQLQNSNANSPSKRGSLARYSSGDETQEETNMPPPAVKMRNRRKTTGSAELRTAIADSSVSTGTVGRNDSDRTFRERKSFASTSLTNRKTYDTDSDSDVVEGSRLRKSKRFSTSVSDRSPQPALSRQSPKIEPAKSWRERTPELPSVGRNLTPSRSKHSPNIFDEDEVKEEEDVEDEEDEEEEETQEEGDRPSYQSDLLRRLTTGGRFSSSYSATDSPKRETHGSSTYSSLYSSIKPSENYKIFSSKHETVNSYTDKDKYSYTFPRNATPTMNFYGKKSSWQSVFVRLYNNNRKLIIGGVGIFILLIAFYLFLNLNTRIYLSAIESVDNKYPICGQEGVDRKICVEQNNLHSTLEVSKVLIPWLLDLTAKAYCESSASESIEKPTVTEDQAKSYLISKIPSRRNFENDLKNLKILILSNPEWEIEVVANGENDINAILFNGSFAARSVDLPIGCYLRRTAYSMLQFLLYVTCICGAVFLCVFGFRMFKLRQEHHKQEVYKMVNKILNLLGSRHEQNIYPGYVAVNNCRDELIQPIERDVKRKVWQDAVDFIEKHESRVRAEMHSVRGESVKVWRWLPAGGPPISPNSSAEGPVLSRLM